MTGLVNSVSVWRISSPIGVPPGSHSTRTVRFIVRSRSASNWIWVDLPLPSVPSNVMKRPFISGDAVRAGKEDAATGPHSEAGSFDAGAAGAAAGREGMCSTR